MSGEETIEMGEEEEEDLSDASGDELGHQMLNVCNKFTDKINDLTLKKRNESLTKSREAHLCLDQANAAKDAAKQDMQKKETKLKSLKKRLELLQRQVTSFEEEVKNSRERFKECENEAKAANTRFRYSVKELTKYQAADKVTANCLKKYFEDREKLMLTDSNELVSDN